MEIQFKVNNQTVKRIGENKPANHSQEFLKLSFDFMTDDWQGLTKFALFKTIEGIAYRVALTDNSCIVPNAVLQEDRFLFSVYGVNNEDVRATTNLTQIYISESGYTRDVENDIPDDDPSVVEQIYLDIDAAKSEAESNAKDYADDGLALKVNISDIVDDCESIDADKPLSAKQGKWLWDNIENHGTIIEGIDNAVNSLKMKKQTTADTGNRDTYYLEISGGVVGDKIQIPANYDDRYYTESEIDTKLNGKADTVHTHKEADITDLKSYALADHNHDSRYYTKSEVDTLISNLKHDLLNRCNFTSDKQIIQTSEIADITAFLIEDGIPKSNDTIYFYEKEDN